MYMNQPLMYTITRPAAKIGFAKMAVKTSFVYAVAVIVFTCVYTVYGQQGATPAPCTTSFRDYQCNDGNGCYSDYHKCDSLNTCDDKTDELNCDSCVLGFYCVLSRQCVSDIIVCNGHQDCLNGEDEDVTFCSTHCTSGYGDYPCKDRNGCYSDYEKCDGYNECNDKTDELNCDSCRDSLTFYCLLSQQCVSNSLLCDGNTDCLNGEDEDVTFCSTHCTSGYGDYKCKDGNGCYYDFNKCDSYNSCDDKTDDFDCDSCDVGAFYCGLSRQCVNRFLVCDGRQDCLNGEDENLPECNPTIWMYWTGGQMAGIVIGYVIFLVIVIAIVVVVHKNCKK